MSKDEKRIPPPEEWVARATYSIFSAYVSWWLARRGFSAVVVTSGYRNPEKNAQVGGAANSAHLHGLAVDVAIPPDRMKEVADAWRAQGPGWYAQTYRGHVHLNAPRDVPARVLVVVAGIAVAAVAVFGGLS